MPSLPRLYYAATAGLCTSGTDLTLFGCTPDLGIFGSPARSHRYADP